MKLIKLTKMALFSKSNGSGFAGDSKFLPDGHVWLKPDSIEEMEIHEEVTIVKASRGGREMPLTVKETPEEIIALAN